MLTPVEIQKKVFNKGFRGYVEQEVDEFIEKVRMYYERLYKENMEMKDLIADLNDKLNQYKILEETLKDTLVVAQQTAEEVKKNAEKEKELIIKEAEEQAKKIIQSANLNVIRINSEYEEAIKEFNIFKTRFTTFLKAQLEMINSGEWVNDVDYERKEAEIKNGE
ncbi:MAG TPA: DivIVA domain-containing protein [Thermoanaerobacterales bacterium]|nr:DivIVA domain-containing protein [Thermoanaerobacterales bacterium]